MAHTTARIGAVLALGAAARDAAAYEAAVDARLDAQVYQVTSPYGAPILSRRRYTETLGVRVVDIQGAHDPGRGELLAVMRLRLDADFGQDPAERNAQAEDRYVPGVSEMPLDLMMAYVEGRNYAGGHVGFRLGRQYVVDPLGFWSFDGALVRLDTDAFVAFEAYGGFEQRGGLPLLSTSRFEGDGVFRGDRRGLDGNYWPAYLSEKSLAPAYGFSVASSGLSFLDARLTYRKVIDQDTVLVSPYPDARGEFATTSESRTSSERVGAAVVATAKDLGSFRADGVYDLYFQKPTEYSATADVRAVKDLSFGAGAEYFLPTFDGDSIFNWFSHEGTTTFTGRARWSVTRRLAIGASGGVRRFGTDGLGTLTDTLASFDAAYRAPALELGLRGTDEEGSRGERRGADVFGRRTFQGGTWDTSVRLSLYQWADALRPDRDATSFTYVLGGGFSPYRKTRVAVEFEHSINELAPERFRALATLDFTVL
ncbi:MAG TPA: hypothetical protein VHE30_00430 [Polyangiaceae bacterium]|nr:hypothetical protein [Polyangiaceae bacterium]